MQVSMIYRQCILNGSIRYCKTTPFGHDHFMEIYLSYLLKVLCSSRRDSIEAELVKLFGKFFYIQFLLFKPFSPTSLKFGPPTSAFTPFFYPYACFRNFPTFSFPYFLITLKTYVHTPQEYCG